LQFRLERFNLKLSEEKARRISGLQKGVVFSDMAAGLFSNGFRVHHLIEAHIGFLTITDMGIFAICTAVVVVTVYQEMQEETNRNVI